MAPPRRHVSSRSVALRTAPSWLYVAGTLPLLPGSVLLLPSVSASLSWAAEVSASMYIGACFLLAAAGAVQFWAAVDSLVAASRMLHKRTSSRVRDVWSALCMLTGGTLFLSASVVSWPGWTGLHLASGWTNGRLGIWLFRAGSCAYLLGSFSAWKGLSVSNINGSNLSSVGTCERAGEPQQRLLTAADAYVRSVQGDRTPEDSRHTTTVSVAGLTESAVTEGRPLPDGSAAATYTSIAHNSVPKRNDMKLKKRRSDACFGAQQTHIRTLTKLSIFAFSTGSLCYIAGGAVAEAGGSSYPTAVLWVSGSAAFILGSVVGLWATNRAWALGYRCLASENDSSGIRVMLDE